MPFVKYKRGRILNKFETKEDALRKLRKQLKRKNLLADEDIVMDALDYLIDNGYVNEVKEILELLKSYSYSFYYYALERIKIALESRR